MEVITLVSNKIAYSGWRPHLHSNAFDLHTFTADGPASYAPTLHSITDTIGADMSGCSGVHSINLASLSDPAGVLDPGTLDLTFLAFPRDKAR